MVSTRATSRGNHRSLVRACDGLCGSFCSCDFPESQRKLGSFALSFVRNTLFGVYPFRCKVYNMSLAWPAVVQLLVFLYSGIQ